jgi:DnaJ-class molecular chaperone
MKVLSFTAWKNLNPEAVENAKSECEKDSECEECGGDGEHTCDCGDVHTCDACDGTGKQHGHSSPESMLREMYENQKRKDWDRLVKHGIETTPVVTVDENFEPV